MYYKQYLVRKSILHKQKYWGYLNIQLIFRYFSTYLYVPEIKNYSQLYMSIIYKLELSRFQRVIIRCKTKTYIPEWFK